MIRVLEEVWTEMGASDVGVRPSIPGISEMSPLWLKDNHGNSVLDIDKRRAPKTTGITRISNLSQAEQLKFLES